jgi:hypothetical protein
MRDSQDVITRLRASKRRMEDEHYQEGQKAGRAWAEATAEAGELQRLENWQAKTRSNWDSLFTKDTRSAWSVAELMVFTVRPDNDEIHVAAEEFWEFELGDNVSAADNPQFVKGFIDGALDLWYEVKEQL